MVTSLKEDILKLRNEGKNYKEIEEQLKCSKATISYHCNNNNLGGNYVSNKRDKLSSDEIKLLNDYYQDHTIEECMANFNLGKSTVIKHTKNKHVKLSDDEIKNRNYNKVKTFRQKLKIKAIEYKGGCCQKCGYNKYNSALEFHHLNPTEKDFGFSSYTVLSWDKIKEELDKCILVCANCHIEIHEELT